MNSKIFKWAGLKKKLVMVAILSFSLGMSMTSCTDWLEMESYTSDDVDYIFENETKADFVCTRVLQRAYTQGDVL